MLCTTLLVLVIHGIISVFHVIMKPVVTQFRLMELQFPRPGWRRRKMMRRQKNGGFNVINVKPGSIRSVLCLTEGGMMVVKLNTHALIVIYRRLKRVSVSRYHRVLFLGQETCPEQFSVTTLSSGYLEN
uniref:Uncharacterized protein n=2 Tax=Opuntia streptacantha TaxID=393608 RepID=A0A7C9EJD9_OPUST